LTTYLFQKVAKLGQQSGIDINSTEDRARQWFREWAKKMKGVQGNDLMRSDPQRLRETITPTFETGRCTMFYYDATTKAKTTGKGTPFLKYWDMFPVIFVLGPAKEGFLGINLHYLAPYHRARLMDALYTTMTSPRTTQSKMKINYDILKGASRFKLFKPCVKHYKWKGVKSQFYRCSPEEWDFIVMLPLERFIGNEPALSYGSKSKLDVWRDSMEKIARSGG
jgi:hypothetical protein